MSSRSTPWRNAERRTSTSWNRTTKLAEPAPLAVASPVLPGADRVAFLDIDDTVRQVYGYAKGVGRGHTGVKGFNALIATLSTPLSVSVIAAARLRKGSTNSVRGAASLLAHALATAPRAGATGLLIVRADSAFYGYDIISAARRAGARFSVTARRVIGGGRRRGCGPVVGA